MGDLDVAAPAAVSAQLDKLVARLAAGLGADEVDQIATHGIRYVIVDDAGLRRDPLVESLDGQRGLRRLSSRDGAAVWQVVPTASRAQAIDPTAGDAAGTVTIRTSIVVPTVLDLPRAPVRVDTDVAAGKAGRTLVVSETADSRWRWTVDGSSVIPTAGRVPGDDTATDPALQQAGLVASSVPVTVTFDGPSRTAWLWAQAVSLLLVLLLALPSRRAEEDDDADTFDGGDLSEPSDGSAPAGVPAADSTSTGPSSTTEPTEVTA
jgi:hypothetical protein